MDDIGSSFITFVAAAVPTGDASGTLGGLLFFIGLAIGVSFFCSMLEAGLLSTPPSYIETQAEKSPRATSWFQKAKEDVDEPLTAILTLNTFAHTFGAAGAGAQAVGVFGSQWAAVITFILTILILVFSEIIPKTLGAVYWKQLFVFNAYSLRVLVPIFYPVVSVFKRMMNGITPHEKAPTITRAEFEIMATIGSEEGSLDESEHRILKNLLHLDRVQVGDIMTPRTVMMAFPKQTTIAEVMADKKAIPYSRIPVYQDHIDDILGFALRHDILQHAADDKDNVPLGDLVREMHVVPETLPVTKAMDEFMQRKQHIFLVIDEYGGTAGIISLEDVVESLLGVEITDESDIAADLRLLAQQRAERQRMLQQAAGNSGYNPPHLASG
ncbi:MAG: HlyC/CorC family transporter [Anaerolineaceae bacterium]|nr:MAG: HlyC/CorC family transporter [Anaerolineaceae bacterium]